MSIYLDNNATTMMDPQVAQAMASALLEIPGNPSSLHQWGRAARTALQQAREVVAASLGVSTQEVLFHSGGTEGLNQIINALPAGEIISTRIEHACIDQLLKQKNTRYISVGEYGAATADQVKAAITPDTRAIVLMAVNNETGVKTDIPSIASLAKQYGIPFIVDGVCWMGKEKVHLPDGVSAAVFSAHKFHGPKGVGFTIIRKGFKVPAFIIGGPQEQGRRGGTENLPGIIGLAKALTLLTHDMSATESLRHLFESEILSALPHAKINGTGSRVCNTSNIAFEGVDGETLLAKLDLAGLAASHGSACSSGAREPSRVLLQMGYSHERVRSSVRFSLSRMTTEDEIKRAAQIVIKAALKP